MAPVGRVLIYGGNGALGAKCVSHFKANNYWVCSVDFTENAEADCNVIVKSKDDFEQQEAVVLSSVGSVLNGSKIDGIFCVAGGWMGGNAKKDLAKTAELMGQQIVCSSLITATVAANYLKDEGIVQLTGAKVALEATPGMIGYGMAKAAVHQLTKSLAHKDSGLPMECTVVAVLPVTLDTPMNRKYMTEADVATWTPLEFVAELFLRWVSGKDRPRSGSFLQLETRNFNTEVIPV